MPGDSPIAHSAASLRTTLTLKQGRERTARAGHPWIFSGAIERVEGDKPSEGALVRVLDSQRKPLGVGLFGGRTIAVKLLSSEERSIDEAFFAERLTEAWKLRQTLGLVGADDLNCFRLVHGEGDFLPGLIIDCYDSLLSIEYHSEGYKALEAALISALTAVIPGVKQIVVRGGGKDGDVPRFVVGTPTDSVNVLERGVKLSIPITAGQKTGYFLDQRENRVKLGKLAQGRSVLDLFSYIGGFALHAARHGATAVTAVDSSKSAVALIQRNAALNDAKVTAVAKEVFQYLEDPRHPKADIVVVDPPAFVKQRQALESGKKGYVRLNRAALDKVKPGGLLATFSCSQLVSEDDFMEIISQAAIGTERPIQLLEKLGQAPCHPTSLAHREARYLKGLLLRVG